MDRVDVVYTLQIDARRLPAAQTAVAARGPVVRTLSGHHRTAHAAIATPDAPLHSLSGELLLELFEIEKWSDAKYPVLLNFDSPEFKLKSFASLDNTIPEQVVCRCVAAAADPAAAAAAAAAVAGV